MGGSMACASRFQGSARVVSGEPTHPAILVLDLSYHEEAGPLRLTLTMYGVPHPSRSRPRASTSTHTPFLMPMGIKMLPFPTNPLRLRGYEIPSILWLANPNRGHGHFPRNICSSHEHLDSWSLSKWSFLCLLDGLTVILSFYQFSFK